MRKKKPHLEHPESEASFFSGVGVSVILFSIVVIGAILFVINRDTPNRVVPNTDTSTITNLPASPGSPIADLERIHMDSLRNTQGEGSLTLIEFSDMTCEFCKRYHGTVSELMAEYNGKVAYSFKHFPLEGAEAGRRAALAAECANDQGAFFTYVEDVFAADIPAVEIDAKLMALAKDSDLDARELEACQVSKTYEDRVNEDTLQALATGATGAPWSILVDSEGRIVMRFKGAIGKKRLKEAIDMALEDKRKNE